MNIVEAIKEQLSGDATTRLSAALGEDQATTRSAVGATVPSLLASLAGLSNTSEGARKLAAALGSYHAEADTRQPGAEPGQLLEQGTGLINSLFGSNVLSSFLGALGQYTGLSMNVVKKLVAYVMPIALGVISRRFAGRSITPEGLTSFFSEQRANIANAMPSGLSLPQAVVAPARPSYATERGESNFMKWLLPLAALALICLGLYWWGARSRVGVTTPPGHPESGAVEPQPPAVAPEQIEPRVTLPNATTLSRDLSGTYLSLTDTLGRITDPASAEQALPALRNFNAKLDTFKAFWDRLPEDGRSMIRTVTSQRLGKFKDEMNRVLAIPGVGPIVKPVLDNIVAKLNAMGG
jgi:hypothetical protein